MMHRDPSKNLEYCHECDIETIHRVSIELKEERDTGPNVAYSREPYRVTECERCHTKRSERMQ